MFAPRADPELSNVDCSEPRISIFLDIPRWRRPPRDPRCHSYGGPSTRCITAAELATAGGSRNEVRGRK